MSILPSATTIANNVNTSATGTITFEELATYFAAVNAQYEREGDGTKESAGILRNLNPGSPEPCCSVSQFANYLSTTFAKYPDKLNRLMPLSEKVLAASEANRAAAMVATSVAVPTAVVAVAAVAAPEKQVQALPPAHLTGGMEAPVGVRNEGSYTRSFYTEEQQLRLSVDEDGKKVENKDAAAKQMQALPPAHLTGGMEAPKGIKDMGSFTRSIYNEEQQLRLSVNEDGKTVVAEQKKATETMDATAALLELAFNNFDADKNGTVSCQEFCDFANTLGGLGKMNNEQVAFMIASVDSNNNGILELDEFKQLICNCLRDEFGDINEGTTWHTFFTENFLTKRQAREFNSQNSK